MCYVANDGTIFQTLEETEKYNREHALDSLVDLYVKSLHVLHYPTPYLCGVISKDFGTWLGKNYKIELTDTDREKHVKFILDLPQPSNPYTKKPWWQRLYQ